MAKVLLFGRWQIKGSSNEVWCGDGVPAHFVDDCPVVLEFDGGMFPGWQVVPVQSGAHPQPSLVVMEWPGVSTVHLPASLDKVGAVFHEDGQPARVTWFGCGEQSPMVAADFAAAVNLAVQLAAAFDKAAGVGGA